MLFAVMTRFSGVVCLVVSMHCCFSENLFEKVGNFFAVDFASF